MAQLADGIDYAHMQGVLHRDLKPSNVLLDAAAASGANDGSRPLLSFTPKITDFGLARVEDLTDNSTRSGLVMGTPNYMAPEQAEGRAAAYGPATDVYGLGAILYEMLTGRPPFCGANDTDTLRRLVSDDVVRPRKRHTELSRDLEAICLKCLEKDPLQRYTSAGTLAADLRRYLSELPTEARSIGPVRRFAKSARRRPAAAGLLAVSALAMVTVVIGSLMYSASVTSAYRLAEQNRQEAEQHQQEAENNRREAESQTKEAEKQRHEADGRRAEAQSLVRDLRREVYVKDIARAVQIWEQGDAGRATALLDEYQPKTGDEDLRGFEWYHLQPASKIRAERSSVTWGP